MCAALRATATAAPAPSTTPVVSAASVDSCAPDTHTAEEHDEAFQDDQHDADESESESDDNRD